MKMKMKLFEPIEIGNKTAANRIMMPPVVTFGVGTANGEIGEFRMKHYEQRAKDGVGTIVIEAAAVQQDYLITPAQVGVWSDDFIPELKKLADAVHKYPAVCTVQLQHAGGKPYSMNNPELLNRSPFGPSAGEYEKNTLREATVEELEGVRESYVASALRVQEAGFDGVEIHNAHGYLLTQMVSPLVNKRTDDYGGSIAKRMKLSLDILHGIRKTCGNDFIIGVRLGANEPTYEEGIQIAKIYEANGIDYLSMSSGYGDPSVLPPPPDDFPYNSIVYGGALVRKNITSGVPVVLVNNIQTAERGEWLLQNGHGDMIAYGKPLLATPDFVSRAKVSPANNNDCIGCRRCFWAFDSMECPLYKKHAQS